MSENQDVILVQQFLDQIKDSELYPQFLAQIQKDISRAGMFYKVQSVGPKDLFLEIEKLIRDTLQHNFNDYVNLLYAVDVSEGEVRKADDQKLEDIARYATYLILKREWQKVYYRNIL